MAEEVIISVDLGGTRCRAARLNRQLEILERRDMLTRDEDGFETTIQRIKEHIHTVIPANVTLAGIGVSAPGPLNPETGVIVRPPNLLGWHNVPLGDILRDEFAVPIYIGNDANVAALAETARGAAQGCRHMIYITVSTGIGSGMIVNGRLLLGTKGLAAEAGHIIMITEEGRVSTLEKEAAGPALARKAIAHIEAGTESVITGLVNGELSQVDGSVVGEAAKQGDKLALDVVAYGGRIVGLGVVSLLHLFNPEVVVIGGGVSKVGDLLFNPIRETVVQHCIDEAYWQNLRIVPAGLGGDVSIIGAGALVITQGGQEDVSEIVRQLQAQN